MVLKNIVGVSFRSFKFGKERIVNENNKVISFTIDEGEANITGSATVNLGDYTIYQLLSQINSQLAAYGVAFSLIEETKRVVLTFDGAIVQEFITIYPNTILRALGFPNGICMYRTAPPASSSGADLYDTSAVAPNAFDISTTSDMVVRIRDVEAIMSNDPIVNRSTMVLYGDADADYTVNRNQEQYISLLQVQQRLQVLRIQLLNTQGDLYDTINNEATFLICFYCMRDTC